MGFTLKYELNQACNDSGNWAYARESKRGTLTSSKVSPLALNNTRKALISASLASFSRKSRVSSASDSDKCSPWISDSINCPREMSNKEKEQSNQLDWKKFPDQNTVDRLNVKPGSFIPHWKTKPSVQDWSQLFPPKHWQWKQHFGMSISDLQWQVQPRETSLSQSTMGETGGLAEWKTSEIAEGE